MTALDTSSVTGALETGAVGGTSGASTTPSGSVDGLQRLTTGASQRQRRKVPRSIRRLSGPALILFMWWFLTTATGRLSPNTMPSPSAVIDVGIELIRIGRLQSAMWASLQRVLIGLAFGVSAGLVIAVLAGLTTRGEDLIDSSMQVFKAIPNFALTPLLIIWMGIDEGPKIMLIAMSTAMPIYMNTYGAIRNVDNRLVETARTMGVGRIGLVRHIVVPGAVPGFLVGLRISLTNAWLALVFAEQINAPDGLGKLMNDARNWFRLDIMVLVIVIYAILGLLSYSFVRLLERRLLAWRRGFQGE
jgi:sulfonate transport system permease protein